jgi:6-pyruvoyltetrahydropterin/6-carboxytetrahydropterin synthase
MYKLNVTSHFSAAHMLKGYNGECKELHGHNWKVRVGIECESTDEIGLAIDFKLIKKHLNELMGDFDHKFLNELDCFKEINPTSENIARVMYQQLSEKFNCDGCKVADVEIWESDSSSVVYYE